MDPIERGLEPTIPLGEAASFFLKLKHGSVSPSEKQAAELRDRLREAKEKDSEGMGMGMPQMPAGAMGKNMAPMPAPAMPAAAMGQHKMGAARGPSRAQERAHESLETKYEKHKHTGNERLLGHMGGAAGAVGGALLGAKHSPHVGAAGALAGYGIGKALGKDFGTAVDAHKFKNKHAMFKRALQEQGMAPAQGDDGEVPITDYLANEQDARAAEEEGQAAYLRQRLQEAQAQLQQAQQEVQMSNQSAQQLQQSQAAHEQQMQSMQQQAQLATEAAMQNVQQAHELALKATTQALQAKDDAINTHQMAAQMRMSYQDMRGQIMDTVAQDNAAPIGEAIKAKGLESQVMGPNAENVGPDGQMQAGGPAEEASDPNAAPGSPPPTGEDHGAQANGDGQNANPLDPSSAEAKPAGQAGVKEANFSGAVSMVGGKLRDRIPHMLVGGAVGAGLPMLESRRGHDGLREQVGKLQQKHDQEGGFGNALALAQSKMRLAIGEIAENHPTASTIAGGALGVAAGAIKGPDIYQMMSGLPGKINELRSGK